jgi:5-methylcytosine-specific restriction endonuclease McrA
MPRMQIPRKSYTYAQRNKIAAKQGWHCYRCKTQLPPHFHIDHIIALCNASQLNMSADQANAYTNLSAMCPNCHASKTYLDLHPAQYEFETGRSKYFSGGPLDITQKLVSPR